LLIESLPEADSIIVIWFKLLCLAGKQNNSGVFTMNGKIPYTDKMLATIFRRKETIVQMALKTFEQFGMVELIDDVITIPNWGKHQSADYMTDRRDYMRNYMSEYRSKQKLLVDSKPNSKPHVNPQEGDKKRLDKKENKEVYGEFQNVLLTVEEYEKLCTQFSADSTRNAIEFLSAYKIEKPKYKTQSDYLTMRRWVFDAVSKQGAQGKPPEKKSGNIFADMLKEEQGEQD
jgi:predicted phage replisome organizer